MLKKQKKKEKNQLTSPLQICIQISLQNRLRTQMLRVKTIKLLQQKSEKTLVMLGLAKIS